MAENNQLTIKFGGDGNIKIETLTDFLDEYKDLLYLINTELGYKPVTFSELTDDEDFWKGCQSCVNYDILTRTNRKHCLCTGMLMDPNAPKKD